MAMKIHLSVCALSFLISHAVLGLYAGNIYSSPQYLTLSSSKAMQLSHPAAPFATRRCTMIKNSWPNQQARRVGANMCAPVAFRTSSSLRPAAVPRRCHITMGGPARIRGRSVECTDNFHEAPMEIDGLTYSTCEHYFQAMKFTGADDASTQLRETIRQSPTALKAWYHGQSREAPIRKDWERVKAKVMYTGVAAKFAQHPELAATLVATGSDKIRAAISTDDWQEANGYILERVREELKPEEQRDTARLAELVREIDG